MKIGLDIRSFLSGETGVGVYFKNLLHAMSDLESEHSFYLLSSSFRERFPHRSLPEFRNKKFIDLKIPVSVLNLLWFRFRFPPMGLFFREKLDLTHSPNPLITPGGEKKIITVHDLSFIDTPDLVMKEAVTYFAPLIKKSVKRADGIISVSHFTRSRIGDIFGKEAEEKTHVIYHGSDLNRIEEKKPRFDVPDRFFLFTGTIEPRKNLAALIRGFALTKRKSGDLKLILAGGYGSQFGEISRLISILRLEDDVILPGYLKREELKYLYNQALALVFPSHYEGFGLPVLEAASCGTPSLVSDIEVFREIFKDYPIFFNKDDPQSLADAMDRISSDKTLLNEKKKIGLETGGEFSWKKAAEETLEVYQKI